MSNNQIFKATALSAREQVTEWRNVKEKLGTQIGGKFLGYWEVPAKDQFKEQLGVALQDLDNPSVVYGVNLPKYFQGTLSEYVAGDLCGFEYYKDTPSKKPGISPTKSLRAYNEAHLERKAKNIKVEGKPDAVDPTEDSGPDFVQ